MGMAINKKMVNKGGKKKKRKITSLNVSDDSGDGDSGSDFKLSSAESSACDEVACGTDSDLSDEVSNRKRRRGGQATRRSTRERRRRSDDDFVCDESESDED